MQEMMKHRTDVQNQTAEQKKARDRMALFPSRGEVLFVDDSMWVVSRLFALEFPALLGVLCHLTMITLPLYLRSFS